MDEADQKDLGDRLFEKLGEWYFTKDTILQTLGVTEWAGVRRGAALAGILMRYFGDGLWEIKAEGREGSAGALQFLVEYFATNTGNMRGDAEHSERGNDEIQYVGARA